MAPQPNVQAQSKIMLGLSLSLKADFPNLAKRRHEPKASGLNSMAFLINSDCESVSVYSFELPNWSYFVTKH